jgi:hypothetical protein
MKTLTIEKVESILKRKFRAEQARRAKARKSGDQYDREASHNQPLPDSAWRTMLALDWQVKNQRFKGHNGKATLDPIDVEGRSYGHWCFVRRINGKVVFNNYRYSVTTSGHQSAVRYLLADLGIKIDLEFNMGRESLDSHSFRERALLALYERLFTLELASKRRNAKDRSHEIKEVKAQVRLARSLGAKCTRETIAKIKATCEACEVDRLADLREKRERENAVNRATTAMLQTGVVFNKTDLTSLPAA